MDDPNHLIGSVFDPRRPTPAALGVDVGAWEGVIARALAIKPAERFASSKRDDKTQTSLVLDKIVAEMKSRISARAHKETQRRKNALGACLFFARPRRVGGENPARAWRIARSF